MFSTHYLKRCLSSLSAFDGVLSDIKILDMTRVLAGPFCTMLLADLGAHVIKVEKPYTGDETRVWGPPFISKDMSCYFASVNRNKKSVVIDLKQTKGVKLILELAKNCDVLVENYVPGKLSKIGLGYEDVKKINPRLIYASITGFGSNGPYAQRSGYDVIAASIGGLLSITGPEDGDPCKAGVAITDLTTGLYVKSAILSALLYREKANIGCKIDCNLLSSQISLLTNLASNYLNCGAVARRRGTAHESIVPYQSFKCLDGKWITVGAGSNQMFAKLCSIIGLNNALDDERYQTNADRVKNRDQLIDIIATNIKQKPIDEWLKLFEGSGIPYGPVNDIDDVFWDQQVVYNNCVVDSYHPRTGNIRMLKNAVNYQTDSSDLLKSGVTSPPLLGEHTVEVLKSILDYNDLQIKTLLQENVIQCNTL